MEPGGGGESEGGVERERMVRQFEEVWHAKLTGFHKDDIFLTTTRFFKFTSNLKHKVLDIF